MRGEGNHKIPGSFAPENMEKTGAERVKYSLACQHEDAIPIKFVSYAQKCPTVLCTFAVALRKESVDRNYFRVGTLQRITVALRKESVDRNKPTLLRDNSVLVALRKESVDRNCPSSRIAAIKFASLSARRAWIEIVLALGMPTSVSVALRKESVDRNNAIRNICAPRCKVALRKESVDRNICVHLTLFIPIKSLSARRAWIEILV